MNHQLKSLLVTGGLLGAGYLAFNYLSAEQTKKIDLKSTRKIIQQVKYQILMLAINFAQGSREAYSKSGTNKNQREEYSELFRKKMAEIYAHKQKLVLDKFQVSESDFAAALKIFAKDAKIKQIQEEILEMMSQAVEGVAPDLSVDQRALNKFSSKELVDIYQQMNKVILIKVISKLQQDRIENPHLAADLSIKNVIKSLNIYDVKIDFLKQRGFEDVWGCPNETFFKISESTKFTDPDFQAEMLIYEKAYNEIIDIAAETPESIDTENFEAFYNKKVREIIQQKQVNQQVPQPQPVAEEKEQHLVEEQTKTVVQAELSEPVVPIVPVQLVVETVESVPIETQEIEKQQEQEKQEIAQSIVEAQKSEVEKQIESDVNGSSQQQNKEEPALAENKPEGLENEPTNQENNAESNKQSE